MDQQQLRSIRLEPQQPNGLNGATSSDEEVLIAALGTMRRATPGRSVRDTLAGAGIMLPAAHQTLRINSLETNDLEAILHPGEKVTIVNRVAGGSC
jgi:hypothetical protein